jgi:hypothetical protein
VRALALVAPDAPPLEQAEETRDRLLHKLAAQRRFGLEMYAWYEGRQLEPAVTAKYRDAYRLVLQMATTPWARLVIDTIAERLQIQGYHSGQPAGQAEEDEAWAILQGSHIDADQRLVYMDSLLTGVGYVTVAPPDSDEPLPRLAIESSMEVTHEPVLGNRRATAAALKLFPADWSGVAWICELYTPETTWRWAAELEQPLAAGEAPIDSERAGDAIAWQLEPGTPNAFGVVPVVPFENRQTILGGGQSELADLIPILRRIDKLTLDSLVTSEFSAFRQRWATGLEVPRDPETGNPVEPFKSAVDRLWINEKPDGHFGSFDQTDMTQYLKMIDAQIAALAAISRVPSHYLLQSELANPPSAESLIAGESGLVAKVRERQRQFGESWELAIRVAFLQAGEDDWAGDIASEVIWADAELRNPAQVADAAVKLAQIGIPQEALWRYVGATPQEIERWKVQAAAEALLAPAAPAPTGG